MPVLTMVMSVLQSAVVGMGEDMSLSMVEMLLL